MNTKPIKIGDRVRCTKHYDDLYWPKGHEFNVISLVKFNGVVLVMGTNNAGVTNSYIPSYNCELVENSDSLLASKKDSGIIKPETKNGVKMNNVKYHVLDHSIVLNYLGKTLTVSDTDQRYEDVLEAIRNGELDNIPAIVEVERAFEGTGLELKEGLLYAGNQPIPGELNARILQYKEKGIPYDSLLKFWENLKLNPSYNSRMQLFAFLSHNGHPITEDGCFIAYRGVTTDFLDQRTRTFDNSIGAVCKEDRALVDDNPNNTCSKGLHVSCYEYAKNFGPQLVEVKVNPKDVVCVPVDYNGTKMRVCEFEVVAVGTKLRTETVYGHEETEESQDEDEQNKDSVCGECGGEVEDFHLFCPGCGTEL